MARLLLGFFAISFVGLGFLFQFSPAELTKQTDIILPNKFAIQEVRTVYGGMFPALGVLFGFCALKPQFLRFGLIALAIIMGGLLVGRAIALIINGPGNGQFYVLAISEIIGLGLAIYYLKR